MKLAYWGDPEQWRLGQRKQLDQPEKCVLPWGAWVLPYPDIQRWRSDNYGSHEQVVMEAPQIQGGETINTLDRSDL